MMVSLMVVLVLLPVGGVEASSTLLVGAEAPGTVDAGMRVKPPRNAKPYMVTARPAKTTITNPSLNPTAKQPSTKQCTIKPYNVKYSNTHLYMASRRNTRQEKRSIGEGLGGGC